MNQTDADTSALVSAAIGRGKASISDMLQCVAERLDAFGCVLWEVAPGSDLDADPPRGYLFINAAWFPTRQIFAMHDLPLVGTATGSAVLNQKPLSTDSIPRDGGVRRDHPFIVQNNITRMCSVPLGFIEGHRGALNVYRQEKHSPFTANDEARLQTLAKLVPILYQSIRDKVSLELLGCVNRILHEAELPAEDISFAGSAAQEVLQAVCDEVARTFHCLEVSVFLENRLEAPGACKLMATTWPKEKKFPKRTYRRDRKEGITGWVLDHAKPVHIFDLAHFKRDRDLILGKYPGLIWKDLLQLEANAREVLTLDASGELPPLSFMAVPVLLQGQVLGAIRCCVAAAGPYYFAARDMDLLQLVAAQVSHWWSTYMRRYEMQEEIDSWQVFVQSMVELNGLVQQELARDVPDERNIFAHALRLTSSAIKGANDLSVRLVDESTHELYFVETFGQAWHDGNPDEIKRRLERRFPIDLPPPRSIEARLVHEGNVVAIPNVRDDPTYCELFRQIECEIIAPISVQGKVFGVLDIGGTKKVGFPKHAEAVAALLGRQLGLYHHLSLTIGQLRKAQSDYQAKVNELQAVQAQQRQNFEDLAHQLKGPISQARRRAELATEEPHGNWDRQSQLLAIRGLCRKAWRVTMSIGLLADLSRGKPLRNERAPLDQDTVIKMLIEAAQDSELIIDPQRQIRFSVDRDGFNTSYIRGVKVDYDLLAQALNNILDNAAKYSFPNTVVRIVGGLTGKRRFFISVSNVGLRIRPTELRKCIERGWRSDEAILTTGEGSGIGLWIVDHIMRAHGGELVISPTGADHVTEVRLIFPANEV